MNVTDTAPELAFLMERHKRPSILFQSWRVNHEFRCFFTATVGLHHIPSNFKQLRFLLRGEPQIYFNSFIFGFLPF